MIHSLESSTAPSLWGGAALGVYFLHFVLFWTAGPIIGQEGKHPIAVFIFLIGWALGFVGGVCAVVGLFKDKQKWMSILGLVLFPLSVIVTV